MMSVFVVTKKGRFAIVRLDDMKCKNRGTAPIKGVSLDADDEVVGTHVLFNTPTSQEEYQADLESLDQTVGEELIAEEIPKSEVITDIIDEEFIQ